MAAYKNIAIFGASGALGTPITKEIIDSGKFTVTAVTSKTSKSTFPSSVKVVKVDYSSVEEITAALKGQDAVVSAVGNAGFAGQTVFIDAAIAAGVPRFIPSEFGSNLENPKIGALPVFGHKVAIRKYIEEKVAGGANITYTYVINSGFLDWGLEQSFLFNWKGGKPEIYGGGDSEYSSTLLSDVGKGVVGILTHPEETKNRQVLIAGAVITQNRLFATAKKAAPEKASKWEPVAVPFPQLEGAVAESVKTHDFGHQAIMNQLLVTMYGGAAYGQPLKENDNKLLGVKGTVSDEELVELWKKVLA